MVLNMLSTGTMIKSGKVYQNLVINVKPTNQKLIQRATDIIVAATETDELAAKDCLEKAHLEVGPAIIMIQKNVDYETAKKDLEQNDNLVSKVLIS